MTEFKYKHSEAVSRHAAGRRLIALGEALVDGARLELEMEDRCLDLPVGDQLEMRCKVRSRSGGVAVEIDLVWPAPVPTAAETTAPLTIATGGG